MDNEFHSGIEFIKSINVGTDKDPEYIWIASHRKYNSFYGKGKTSIEAVNNLEYIIGCYKPKETKRRFPKSKKSKKPLVFC